MPKLSVLTQKPTLHDAEIPFQMQRELLLTLMFISIVIFPWQSLPRVFGRKKMNEQPAARDKFDPLPTKPERSKQKTYEPNKIAA